MPSPLIEICFFISMHGETSKFKQSVLKTSPNPCFISFFMSLQTIKLYVNPDNDLI